MAPRAPPENARECFERLKLSFDTLKEKHTDPWNWHEYLAPDPVPENEEDEPDAEIRTLKPKKRSNVDRLKVHLMACVAELNRAASAADMAYFHMCVSPQEMRECCKILGTSDDIDEDMLDASGDASPAKIMAALQRKLTAARERMSELEGEISRLNQELYDKMRLAEERWKLLQEVTMNREEALGRLHNTTFYLNEVLAAQEDLKAAYEDLYDRHTRASRLMLIKVRDTLRGIFKANAKENLFYAFNGFVFICTFERNERKRKEELARRDAVEFALRNEVRFLLAETVRCREAVSRLTCEAGRLKIDRRELACRILYKHRSHEPSEYLLWIWELWQPIRESLVLEKHLEVEKMRAAATMQQLVHTASQLTPAAAMLDRMREEVAEANVAKDNARRDITAKTGRQVARLTDSLFQHRLHELAVLRRLHELDTDGLRERIAVLEREIAEDSHIQSLKGMVVDLESRLRRALDRRKARGLVVQPGKADQKCIQCGRESLYRNWKVVPDMPDGDSPTSPSSAFQNIHRLPSPPPVPPPPQAPPNSDGGEHSQGSPWPAKKATFTAIWR